MGQSQSGGHGPGGGKKDGKDKKKKYELPVPTRVGKKKATKGPDAASKLPHPVPVKMTEVREKDYLFTEEEFIRNQQLMKLLEEKQEEERSKVDDLRGTPMSVGTMEEIIDASYLHLWALFQHFSFVDKDLLEPGSSGLLNHKVHAVIDVLTNVTDLLVTVMKVEKASRRPVLVLGGCTTKFRKLRNLWSLLSPILNIMKRWV
ncbi:26S proteasome regulatory subunit 4 [Plecturocebus cupreus]